QRATVLPRLVRGRDHVVERVVREDLRLIEDQPVDLIEATAEATLTRTEQDARTVAELDRLLTGAERHLEHVRRDLLPPREPLHLLERLLGRPQPVSGPDDRHSRP